jgi:uncharacterized protein
MSRYSSTYQHNTAAAAEEQPTLLVPSWLARTWHVCRRWILGAALVLVAAAAWLSLYRATRPLAETLTYSVLNLRRGSGLGDAVAFFLYDAPRILLLIASATFVLSLAQGSVRRERVVALLHRRRRVANFVGAGFGVITPFCSCSAVPIFMSFTSAGVPFSAAISFLTAAPLVNEIALVLLFALFGWKIAVLYLITGVTIAVVSGTTLARLGGERYVVQLPSSNCCSTTNDAASASPAVPVAIASNESRLLVAARSSREILVKVWPYVIVGIAVAAAMHNRLGGDFVQSALGSDHWWTIPAVVVAGIPLYSNAAVFPIAQELLGQGIALGTVLAFMMAVVGLSLPELIILRRVLRLPLIGMFVGVVAIGIIFTGYVFNWLSTATPLLR